MKIKRKKVLKAFRALSMYVQIEKAKVENESWWPVIGIVLGLVGAGFIFGYAFFAS